MNLIARKRDSNGVTALPTRVNHLFDSLFDFGAGFGLSNDAWVPPMDVLETSETIEVYLDLPGVDPKSVDVSIQEDRLELAGQRGPLETPEEARWYRFERPVGAFRRTLSLPVPVDADRATASTEHGRLHIVLPKAAEAMPKRIVIKGS